MRQALTLYLGCVLAGLALVMLASIAIGAEHHGCRMAAYPRDGFTRLLLGCRFDDEVPHTWVATTTPQMSTRLEALFRMTGNQGRLVPMVLPYFSETPTYCDRLQLWAEDEGARAPQMTRAAKLLQACGP